MDKKQFRGAYSRRFSNASTTDGNDNTGASKAFTITRSVNNEAYGTVELLVKVPVGTPGSETPSVTTSSRFTIGSASYPAGSTVKVTAKPNPGFRFISWNNGDYPSGMNQASSFTVELTRSMHFNANFERLPETMRTVHVNWDPEMGRVNAGTSMNGNDIIVSSGATVNLTATPKAGYHFVKWNGAPVNGKTTPEVSFCVNNDYNITAVFAPDGSTTPTGETTDTPLTGGGSGGGGSQGSAPGVTVATADTADTDLLGKAKAFVKKWWWAILIVGYIVYKEKKGGLK